MGVRTSATSWCGESAPSSRKSGLGLRLYAAALEGCAVLEGRAVLVGRAALEGFAVCAERGLARDGAASVGLLAGRLSLPLRVPTSTPVFFAIASSTLGLRSGGSALVTEGPCTSHERAELYGIRAYKR